MNTTHTELLECGHEESPHSDFTRGYGTDKDGNRACYACCAAQDVVYMKEHGKISMYLTKKDGRWAVSNWPGSLVFPALNVKESKGWGFGRSYPIVTAHFKGPDGAWWAAKSQGDMDLCRCKRMKPIPFAARVAKRTAKMYGAFGGAL